jgi:hypothetical protein
MEQGHFVSVMPDEPTLAILADQVAALAYLRQMIVMEKRTRRSLLKREHAKGPLSFADKILLQETDAILALHRQQRDALMFPTRGDRNRGRKSLAPY